MKNAISAEFLKMHRSRILLLAFLVSLAPPAVKMLRFLLAADESHASWRSFLASGQELLVFGLLITVMLISNFIFTMEYRLGTSAVIFTSKTKRTSVYAAKTAVLIIIIVLLLAVSAVSQLLFGYLAVQKALPAELFRQFASVIMWYAFSFIMLSALVALPAVLTKRFVITAVITLGYYILIFPFHSKSLYACPFMTPVVIAAKIYGAADYIFSFDYGSFRADMIQAGIFLESLALISFIAGIVAYRKSNVPR